MYGFCLWILERLLTSFIYAKTVGLECLRMLETAERFIDLVCWRTLYYSTTVRIVGTEVGQTKRLFNKREGSKYSPDVSGSPHNIGKLIERMSDFFET
jgi:hypothetical protein